MRGMKGDDRDAGSRMGEQGWGEGAGGGGESRDGEQGWGEKDGGKGRGRGGAGGAGRVGQKRSLPGSNMGR